MSVLAEPELRYAEVRYRTARKPWRCTCADDVRGRRAHRTYTQPNGLRGESWSGVFPVSDLAGLDAALDRMRAWDGTETLDVELVPNRNAPGRSDDCTGRIAVGDRYIEDLAMATPYGSGPRYCLPCGLKVWGVS